MNQALAKKVRRTFSDLLAVLYYTLLVLAISHDILCTNRHVKCTLPSFLLDNHQA